MTTEEPPATIAESAITVRMPQALRDKITEAAKAEDRSDASFVRIQLAKLLNEPTE